MVSGDISGGKGWLLVTCLLAVGLRLINSLHILYILVSANLGWFEEKYHRAVMPVAIHSQTSAVFQNLQGSCCFILPKCICIIGYFFYLFNY